MINKITVAKSRLATTRLCITHHKIPQFRGISSAMSLE